MRWTAILVSAFALGCARTSPVEPTAPSASPSSFTISGVVRESGTNAPLEGASVCWSPNHEPHCGATGADGSYAFTVPSGLGGPTAQNVQICPGAGRSDFEYRQTCVPWAAGAAWSPVLQRTIQIEAGRSVTATVFPQEGSGLARADDCSGCKRIRIAVRQTGTLSLRLTADAGAALRLALAGPDVLLPIEGPLAVSAGQTVTVLVTGSVAPTEFELSTVLAISK